MKYFKSITSLEDLKKQFRTLARENHPDAGGDPEVMKAINTEYDVQFAIWKDRTEKQTGSPVTETAEGTRRKFYTEFGWEGSNHKWDRTLKEVAQIVRAYVKEKYPLYKFSVRTSYASMCQELHVDLKESPVEIYKSADELDSDDISDLIRKARYNGYWLKDCWNDSEAKVELEQIWTEHGGFFRAMNEVTKAVVEDVDAFVKSYNYEDCDGMIDYFDVDFYYFGCAQNNGMNIKVVPKQPRIQKAKAAKKAPEAHTETELPEQDATAALEQEYEIKEDVHTKTGEKIFIVKIIRKLERSEYLEVAEKMKGLGGYYSRFKHAFVFHEDPSERLVVA